MLLRHRVPSIANRPADPAKGFEHLDQKWIAVVRWLNANRVDYVLVGAAAEAIRGNADAKGPAAIVPAPYRRNFERLSRALWSAHVRMRVGASGQEEADTLPLKMTAEKLARGQRWALRCGSHDLDIEGQPDGAPVYQELLYEANRFELADGVGAEVAAPEDIERYAHIRRTGTAPEIKISRSSRIEQDTA